MSEKIFYRGYWISPETCGASPYKWCYTHENYDGAPEYSLDESPADNRCGGGASVEECKQEIDDTLTMEARAFWDIIEVVDSKEFPRKHYATVLEERLQTIRGIARSALEVIEEDDL